MWITRIYQMPVKSASEFRALHVNVPQKCRWDVLLGQKSLSKLFKGFSLLRNCSQTMHSCPINSPAYFSLLWFAGWQLCSHDQNEQKLPSCRQRCVCCSCSAVTGCPCVRAEPYELCWSSPPYTAILWAPSMPLRHRDLRHTPLTTHLDYYCITTVRGGAEFSPCPTPCWGSERHSLLITPLRRHVVFCNSFIYGSRWEH